MATNKPPEYEPPPKVILDFVAAMMRALNTARLYATDHELFKKNIDEVSILKKSKRQKYIVKV